MQVNFLHNSDFYLLGIMFMFGVVFIIILFIHRFLLSVRTQLQAIKQDCEKYNQNFHEYQLKFKSYERRIFLLEEFETNVRNSLRAEIFPAIREYHPLIQKLNKIINAIPSSSTLPDSTKIKAQKK